MNRIAVICIAIAGAVAGTFVHAADTYPMRPVRMIVPYVAGGNADIQARYIAERLSEVLGTQFVVDNRGGANGMIGLELAARSPADGYTTIVQILKSPQAQERYANVGAEIRYNSPDEFRTLIAAEMAKWGKVIRAAGIRVDQP